MAFLGSKIIALGSAAVKLTRNVHVSAVQQSGLRKWVWNSAGYNKYGLLTDDLMHDQDPDVQEAVRRLPQKLVDERNYRMLRAIQLSIQKDILPKDQWTKYEDDVHYLQPYLKEVQEERREREEWEAAH